MEEGSGYNMSEGAQDEGDYGALKKLRTNSALLEGGKNLGRE